MYLVRMSAVHTRRAVEQNRLVGDYGEVVGCKPITQKKIHGQWSKWR